jgi:hypothetical protein
MLAIPLIESPMTVFGGEEGVDRLLFEDRKLRLGLILKLQLSLHVETAVSAISLCLASLTVHSGSVLGRA